MRSLLILVLVCLSLLVLLIFGWLPRHCPFPELGPLTQTFSVSSCYALIWLGEEKAKLGKVTTLYMPQGASEQKLEKSLKPHLARVRGGG